MNNNEVIVATEIIAAEEGYESNVYIDTLGYPTTGYGLRIGYKDQPLEHFDGFPPMPTDVAERWMSHVIREKRDEILQHRVLREAWDNCSLVRRAVLLSMAYQLGTAGLAKFKNTLQCMIECDWYGAANEMQDSRWYRQTQNRATRHIEMIIEGQLLPYYL